MNPVPAWRRCRQVGLLARLLPTLALTLPGTLPAAVNDNAPRPVLYQLFLRQFSNTNETRKANGTLAENGVGKFRDLDARALGSLRELGITHLWLLGVPRQATATGYPGIGLPADDPDLLKGLAGSPFAIRDYFDVCPDYADDPARRLDEFRALLGRIHAAGLKAVIDFVPNHVARSHQSVVKPALSFGAKDDRTRFFAPANNFFYLDGKGPLRLPTVKDGRVISPTCQVVGGCDGLFEGERDHGKVTGNNVVSWTPGEGDWYETVKLNYGFDFTKGRHGPKHFPTAAQPDLPIPDTWLKMDAVLAHWQELGVDGFRCDMAHWVPMEFWRWAIQRARQRQPAAFFVAEAYDNDPNKLTDGNVLVALVESGFDAVYDDQSYDILKDLYDGPKWANDLDGVLGAVAPLHQSLRYSENHDEVRLAHPQQWGGLGAAVGKPVSAILFAVGRGPLLLYNGQEVGEPALGIEGFGGDDARTSIFDYWSMPELAKWVNHHRYDGGRLSPAQQALRSWYAHLLRVTTEPAFQRGEFVPLNRGNVNNPRYGRLPGEGASGRWLYAFLRHDPSSRQVFLVVANLHGQTTLRNVRITLPPEAVATLGGAGTGTLEFEDRLATTAPLRVSVTAAALRRTGLDLPPLAPLSAWLLELRRSGSALKN
jgi:glycosidase